MAGATGLILSFLAGVMVGRGVDQSAGEVQAARPRGRRAGRHRGDARKPAPPPAEDLTYAQRLESDKTDDGLEQPKAALRARPAPADAASGRRRRRATSAAPPATVRRPRHRPAAVPRVARRRPTAAAAPRPSRARRRRSRPRATSRSRSAPSRTRRAPTPWSAGSRARGSRPTCVSPDSATGSSTCASGNFPARADAERVQARLRDEEKFKPFIVKP